MKKLISTIIFAIMLFACISFTVFAETSVTISEDYQTLSLDGKTYSRINTSILETNCYDSINSPIDLSPTQQEIIQEINLLSNDSKNMIYARIDFYDGATLIIYFLQDDYLKVYDRIVSDEMYAYIIDFEWPEENTVLAKKAALFENSTMMRNSELYKGDYFYVTAQNADGTLVANRGCLILINQDYYYMDYTEVPVDEWHNFNSQDKSESLVHKITDEQLLTSLNVAKKEYYGSDFGFLSNDTLGKSISAIFFIFVFLFIPLIAFILFLILAIRSKSAYKKIFRIIYILSIAELVVFTIISIIFFAI